MKTIKMLKDFYAHHTRMDGLLELYFNKHNYKKGDTIKADLCIFEKGHTLIIGQVVKTYKNKIVMTKNYLELRED